MTNREQVLERSDINAVSKTKVSKTSYDLIDMILLKLNNIVISVNLHRYWICKKIDRFLLLNSFYDVIRNNNIRAIKSLSSLIPCRNLTYALGYAAKFGNLNIIQYLHSIGAKSSYDARYNSSVYGHLDTAQYLHNIDDKFKSYAICQASKIGHLDIVKFLYYNDNGIYEPCKYDRHNDTYKNDIINPFERAFTSHLSFVSFCNLI
jgi:hypothetical protein